MRAKGWELALGVKMHGVKKDDFKKTAVSAYSGYKANERPLDFVYGNEKKEVRQILDRWYGEGCDCFKLLANDGAVYLLKWRRYQDAWLVRKDERVKGSRGPSNDNHGAPSCIFPKVHRFKMAPSRNKIH